MQTPTDREFEVLKILWKKEKTTVREVWNVLRKADPDLAYTTVLSVFQVMEKKGFVAHETVGKAYLYYPLQQKQGTLKALVGNFVSRVFDGAAGEFLLHGIEIGKLSTEELDRLEEQIRKAKQGRQPEQDS